MRLRERKHVNYDMSGVDDYDDCLQDSPSESSHSDATDGDDDQMQEVSYEEKRIWRAGSRKRVKGISHPHGTKAEEPGAISGARARRMPIDDSTPSTLFPLRPRSTRTSRVNYNEDSCSEDSGRLGDRISDEQYDNQSSDESSEQPDLPMLVSQDEKACSKNSDGIYMSPGYTTRGDRALEDGSDIDDVNMSPDYAAKHGSDVEESETRARRRRLIKVSDRCQGLVTKGHSDGLSSKVAGCWKQFDDLDCLPESNDERTGYAGEVNEGVSGNSLHTYSTKTRAAAEPTGMPACSPECISEQIEDGFANAVPSFPGLKETAGATGEIEFLPHTYVRRRRHSKQQSSDHAEVATSLKAAAMSKQARNNEGSLFKHKVDVYGPYTIENENRLVVKKLGQVERILSVQNRGSSSPVYCVKLSGKSYRNAAYVSESLLLKSCPQLLRHFSRRMFDLHRLDGNLGEKENSPAFDPSYIQIDRVIAAEQIGRKKCYLVKWCGLPYSESTWEPEDTLLDDKKALKRFSQIDLKGAPASSTSVFKDGRVLRDYQKKGLAWMDHNFQKHINCILADEMGLGKTIQSVAMLQNLRVKWKIKGPFLVVAPVSTLGHWQREIESLTDMNFVVYSGSMEDRNVIKEYDFYCSSGKAGNLKFNLLLTGYEILMKDYSFLSKHKWQYIIVDEAHRLKTKHSKTTRTLKEMSVQKGGLLLLTGTPVQNNTKEIFSLLNLLDPDQFNSEDEFLSKYGDIQNVEQVQDLQENILKPRLLRRMKEDVERSIPLKEETIIWVELTQDQRSYYRAMYENRITDLLRGSQSNNIPNLRNLGMELRKLCNHPFLCDGLEEHLISKNSHDGHQYVQGEEKLKVFRKVLCQCSGKMLLLDKLLPMLKDAGHRVLIFSQFTILLDLLEDYMHSKGYSFERIDGRIRGYERQAAIDRYSARGSDTFVFLLSTRAGGLGITLTAADTCIIYDSDWNPQNDLQAMARCHRIGQTKDVKIYRLITRNTYEEHLFECSSRKYGLDEAILGNILGSTVDGDHSKNIESLLRRGAYDMMKDDGEAEAAAFHSQNIDQILEQRTQKRLIGGRGNNTFSVATFISNPDIESDEVEDKDGNAIANVESSQFWQDLLPEAYNNALNAEKHREFTSAGPRRRAQVNYKEKGEVSDEGSSDEEKRFEGRKRHVANKRNRDAEVEDSGKQWSEKELKRLENRLMMLGKGRAEQIMAEAGLEHHGLEEVKQLADTLVQFYLYIEEKERIATSNKEIGLNTKEQAGHNAAVPLEAVPLEARETLQSTCGSSLDMNEHRPLGGDSKIDIGSIDSGGATTLGDMHCVEGTLRAGEREDTAVRDIECLKLPSFAQKALTSQNFVTRLQKNASRYLQILHERDVLSRAMSDCSFSRVSLARSRKLPVWWGEAEDLDLMRGALRHGHKEFLKIREDPSLCFMARLSAKRQNLIKEDAVAAQSHEFAADLSQNAESQDQVQEDDWPHDSVLTMRLKKLIECLPNGLSDREIKRRAAVAEAARKRFQELRMSKQNQEIPLISSGGFENIQWGYVFRIGGQQYEQSIIKRVDGKDDIGCLDSRTHSSGIFGEPAKEELSYSQKDCRMPISSVTSCQVSMIHENKDHSTIPVAIPSFKSPLSMIEGTESSFGKISKNSTLISDQLVEGQALAGRSANTLPNSFLCNVVQMNTTSRELVESTVQRECVNDGGAHQTSPFSEPHAYTGDPAGFSGVSSIPWMPVHTNTFGTAVGSSEDETQECSWQKRKAGTLVPLTSKRQKDCCLDISKQEMSPQAFIQEYSKPYQEM